MCPFEARKKGTVGLTPIRHLLPTGVMSILFRRLFGACALLCSSVVLASIACAENPFPYESWENKEGKVLEARFERVKDSKTVVLQSKKGGKRYDLKRSVLADSSTEQIAKYIEESKTAMLEGNRFEGSDIYKAVALGLESDAERALEGKTLSLDVLGFRIDTDKLTAYLELEGGLYAKLRLSGKSEFFEKNKALYVRSSEKGNHWWYSSRNDGASNVDINARLVAREKDRWTFKFTNKVRLEWGRVGVSEGVVITD